MSLLIGIVYAAGIVSAFALGWRRGERFGRRRAMEDYALLDGKPPAALPPPPNIHGRWCSKQNGAWLCEEGCPQRQKA